ncbi:MAG: valine--tRNA ligase [Nanoarchaeota archaeon]|nr:valine--tRNA ligase [Nanoarchaeota archaeon]MBU1321656.1 valine--tRNA ligase [Nanoarchaeota archaeon]MBU1596886.1 valine--tRNA ligase [Nanoarchaeota archaeon]MBU2442325.1 valine--tRNA ligase [Nanoarchaeota archaeon]
MLDKNYEAEKVEAKWQKYWEEQKIYKFNPKSKKPIYSIDTPPPYASSGHLHVGHGLSYTQFEIVARIRRLLGFEVYFPPCFDDNGLPTEKYVEEKLGINKAKTNRAEFRKMCLKESRKAEEDYANKFFRKLGHSYDWDYLYTTISPEAQRVTQTVFLKLVEQGDCYRKEEPVIWCPHHETALAQAEVEDLDRSTKLNNVYFDVADSNEKIEIATTRPEFLPACVGIFVHPEDERYKHLLGKDILVPLFNYKVKVMKDETVDKEFGSGIMMVCTFGDTADIEKWKKYKLELRTILDLNGTLNDLCGKYKGMSLEKARQAMLTDLEAEGKLKSQEPLQQTVGSCWRCSTPVEYIVTKQWFIKTLIYKDALIKRSKEVNWYPDFMRTRFENWTTNLGWDWIISRQRYYGVPIPAWHCDECEQVIFPKQEELPVDPIEVEKKCPKCKKTARPDTDVFDTWMTSSNSPEVASRWLENPEQYKKIAPMTLRPQSHDIIRTWAFYTILKSHLLFNRIPWEDIIINTYVLDPKGKGMSKSKGNVVWMDTIINNYSVDAFRYWVGGASLGSDLAFKEQELVAGKKFLTKLWNSSKFVFMHLENYKHEPKKTKLMIVDKWFLSKLFDLTKKIKKMYLDYNIAGARRDIEVFFWHTFCDNYLEIVKDRLYNPNERGKEAKKSAQYTLYHALVTILKLMSPITPHITEELYQSYYAAKDKENCKSIHISQWPEIEQPLKTDVYEKIEEPLLYIISEVRKYKTAKQMSLKEELKKVSVETPFDFSKLPKQDFESLKQDLLRTIKAKELELKVGKEFKIKIS